MKIFMLLYHFDWIRFIFLPSVNFRTTTKRMSKKSCGEDAKTRLHSVMKVTNNNKHLEQQQKKIAQRINNSLIYVMVIIWFGFFELQIIYFAVGSFKLNKKDFNLVNACSMVSNEVAYDNRKQFALPNASPETIATPSCLNNCIQIS